jgi:hypothetical protein
VEIERGHRVIIEIGNFKVNYVVDKRFKASIKLMVYISRAGIDRNFMENRC